MNARSWLPLASMSTLIVAVGAYAGIRQDAFLTKYNLGNLLITTMPLALVAMGQTCALLVRGFDVSVAALMTMCVVTASFTMKPDASTVALVFGALAVVGVGVATGVFNATLIRFFRLPSIIANQALESIAAAVLGGAALSGGRGSFVGTLLAALFLTEIDNVLPLFQQPTEYAEMTIGALILFALVLYQAPDLIGRLRASRRKVAPLPARTEQAPAA